MIRRIEIKKLLSLSQLILKKRQIAKYTQYLKRCHSYLSIVISVINTLTYQSINNYYWSFSSKPFGNLMIYIISFIIWFPILFISIGYWHTIIFFAVYNKSCYSGWFANNSLFLDSHSKKMSTVTLFYQSWCRGIVFCITYFKLHYII